MRLSREIDLREATRSWQGCERVGGVVKVGEDGGETSATQESREATEVRLPAGEDGTCVARLATDDAIALTLQISRATSVR